MHNPSGARPSYRLALWSLLALLLAGCSAVRLAYNQVPQLAYWQLNRYLDLTEAQADRARSEIDALHQWHRGTLLPRHAEFLQNVQRQLPHALSPDQVCRLYDDARAQLEALVDQVEPRLGWLATQLSSAQLRHLEKKQADSNADWRKEWLEPSPEQLREYRYQQLLSRAERLYGSFEAPQKAALRSFVAQSSFDPKRSYAERLRRQDDLLRALRQVAQDQTTSDQARAVLRATLARLTTSPDPGYQRYAEGLVREGCAGFALVHNASTDAQRRKAAQTLNAYQGDFVALASR